MPRRDVTDRPIIFAYHGYPWLIHRLTYRHANRHVRGYKEVRIDDDAVDMTVRNDMDRFHIAMDVVDRVPGLSARTSYFKQHSRDNLTEHRDYIRKYGDDMPEIRDGKWPY